MHIWSYKIHPGCVEPEVNNLVRYFFLLATDMSLICGQGTGKILQDLITKEKRIYKYDSCIFLYY